MRRTHGGRALLNLPGHHSTAAIVAELGDTADWPLKRAPNGEEYESFNVAPEYTCKITDCESCVGLDLDFLTANQLENSLHKIDTVIDVLSKLREGLIIEHHRLHDRLPNVPVARRSGRYGMNGAEDKRSTILPS